MGTLSSTARPEIHSLRGRPQQETGGSGISLNKRMEALHGLKDRKAKTPTPKEIKRDTMESQDRQAGNTFLARNAVNGAGTPNVIDLTGNTFLFAVLMGR